MRPLLLCLLLAPSLALVPPDSQAATLAWSQKVTDTPGHHAFTDLACFNGNYYLCFRTGVSHASLDGVIHVLRSPDMRAWEHNATIKTLGDDRDPHLALADDQLHLFFGVWDTQHGEGSKPPERHNVRAHTASTADGETWSTVKGLYEPGWWLWRVNRIGDSFYSAAYTALRPTPSARETRLLRSEDGIGWHLVSTVTQAHMCGEADFWQQNDGTLAVLSRSGGSEPARLFTSNADFTAWTDHELSAMVHSPAVAFWKDRVFVAGRGQQGDKRVTKLWELTGTTLEELLVLPSGGDTGYPGLLTVPESVAESTPRFYISWYSEVDPATGKSEPDHGAAVYVGEILVNATE